MLFLITDFFFFFPREERNIKIQYLSRPRGLSEHMEGAGLKETKDRVKIKEQKHVTSNSHKYVLFVIYWFKPC